MISKHVTQMSMVTNANGIEDSKQEHVQVDTAKHGLHKLHMSILVHQEAIQMLDLKETTAETLMNPMVFGATLLTIR
jgi:hypothetical protein